MSKKKTIRYISAFIAACMIGSPVSTAVVDAAPDTENTEKTASSDTMLAQVVSVYERLSGKEIEVPAILTENAVYDINVLKAVTLGCININDAANFTQSTTIIKQDVINMLYKAVIQYDDQYELSSAQARVILNDCADNADIFDENRIAYAFMIKYGIIDVSEKTNPSKQLTESEAASLTAEVYDTFRQNVKISIGGKELTTGMTVSELCEVFGNPGRIDETDYGMQWYVYNSDYSKFFMVGVKNGMTRAFYTNCQSFDFDGIKSGDTSERADELYSNTDGLYIFSNNGIVDAVLFNPFCKKPSDNENFEVSVSKRDEFIDMLNAYRFKNAKSVYTFDEALCLDANEAAIANAEGIDTGIITYSGFDSQQIYNQIVESGILLGDSSADNTMTQKIGVQVDFESGADIRLTYIVGNEQVKQYWANQKTVEPESDEIELTEDTDIEENPVIHVSTEDSFTIELEKPAGNYYYVQVYSQEAQDYAFSAYISTNDTKITIPEFCVPHGSVYTVTVSTITRGGDLLPSESVSVSYGEAEEGVLITAPEYDSVTDDDNITVSWESSVYHDFRVDVYNESGECIANTYLTDEYEALVAGIDPGTYSICVTALERGTENEMSQAWVQISVTDPEPIITETILEPDEVYEFVYENPEAGTLYFYSEEIVDVKVNGTTEQRKKIIRKEIKATHNYIELAAMMGRATSTTGSLTYTLTANTNAQAIIDTAYKYLGVPYLWGGTTTAGFDCSGLMQHIFSENGIQISRTSREQFANDGVFVPQSELQPGDLVFFQANGVIHHVGLYLGNGMMLHAPHTGDVVRVSSMETEYYQSQYAGAKRIY